MWITLFPSRPIKDARMSEILQLNLSEDPPRRVGLVKEEIKGTSLTWESNQTYSLSSLSSCVWLHLFNQDELLIDILTLGESLSITRVHLNKSKPLTKFTQIPLSILLTLNSKTKTQLTPFISLSVPARTLQRVIKAKHFSADVITCNENCLFTGVFIY